MLSCLELSINVMVCLDNTSPIDNQCLKYFHAEILYFRFRSFIRNKSLGYIRLYWL